LVRIAAMSLALLTIAEAAAASAPGRATSLDGVPLIQDVAAVPAPPRPLPDVEGLFHEVEARQKELEQVRNEYAYTRIETDFQVDRAGRTTQKTDREYEVFLLNGNEVSRLVARDGQPLTGAAALKEQERAEKAVRKQQEREKQRARKRAEVEERRANGQDGSDGQMAISDLLRVCQFVNPRRELVRGHELLAFDFAPRAGGRPRNRAESWARKVVGSIWIDEDHKEVARLEGRLTESIKMGGGLLLSLQHGALIVLEQERVNDEVWLPSYVEVRASGRVLLLKGFKFNQTQRFSNYRKFTVETTSQIRPPKE
jgi:hypothetical protein